MTAKVFVVEDHPSMREALVAFVSSLPGAEVCGVAADGEQALAQLGSARADLALIDISLPGMSGFDLLDEIARRWPELPCVVLSGHDPVAYEERAFALGARGYVTKGNADELRDAIPAVLRGQKYPG